MKEKTDCMTFDEYRKQFDEYSEQAKLIPMISDSSEMLQKNLSRIGLEAGRCYKNNTNFNEPDYQHRVDIFLDFDEYLKQLKREFILPEEKKISGCKFFDNESPQTSDSEILDEKRPLV